MAGVAGLVIVLLWGLAAVAWIPRLGQRVLAALRWSHIPIIGKTSGILASLILLGASLLVAGAANAIDPQSTPTGRIGLVTTIATHSSAVTSSNTPTIAPTASAALSTSGTLSVA